jgi:hypothetical protein
MRRRSLRVLVLACCLPLVLPPGWCCRLLLALEPLVSATAPAGDEAPVTPTPPCCCHTHGQQPADDNGQPQNSEDQPREPLSPPFKHCPCSDRQTTLTASAAVPDGSGLVSLAALPIGDPPPPEVAGIEPVAPVARPPTPPLHVRNCVWRC